MDDDICMVYIQRTIYLFLYYSYIIIIKFVLPWYHVCKHSLMMLTRYLEMYTKYVTNNDSFLINVAC